MIPETMFTFNIGVGALIIGIVVFFLSLLAIIWKGKDEIAETIKKEIAPFESIAYAIDEIQTILRNKLKGISIQHTLVEKGSSPLNPAEYGAKLIRDSGLGKILDENKESLCIKLRASLPKDYTDYDVQEKSRELLVSLKDDSMMRPVKEYVYNHPIDIEIVLKVGGLWLRDDFLGKDRQVSKAVADTENEN